MRVAAVLQQAELGRLCRSSEYRSSLEEGAWLYGGFLRIALKLARRFANRKPETAQIDVDVEMLKRVADRELAFSPNDFSNAQAIWLEIDRSGSGPGEKGSCIDDCRLLDRAYFRFVCMADYEEFWLSSIAFRHVDSHLRGRFPMFENLQDARRGPGLPQENLQFSPNRRIVVLQAGMFFDAGVFDRLEETVERDVAFASEATETAFRYLLEEPGVLAPGHDVFENSVAMGDQQLAVV